MRLLCILVVLGSLSFTACGSKGKAVASERASEHEDDDDDDDEDEDDDDDEDEQRAAATKPVDRNSERPAADVSKAEWQLRFQAFQYGVMETMASIARITGDTAVLALPGRPAMVAALGVETPAPAPRTGDDVKDFVDTISWIANDLRVGVGTQLAARHDMSTAAAFELGLHLALVYSVYGPKFDLSGFAERIEHRGALAGVPPSMLKPTIDGIRGGQPSEPVQAAADEARKAIRGYLHDRSQ